MVKAKKKTSGKSKDGRPDPLVPKAGFRRGKKYGCGGKLK